MNISHKCQILIKMREKISQLALIPTSALNYALKNRGKYYQIMIKNRKIRKIEYKQIGLKG